MAVRETLLKTLSSIPQHLVVEESAPTAQPPRPTFLELVEQAKQDWMAAKSYFENVSEPELVDHAIYLIEAAETKYMYLLRKARVHEDGLTSTR